MKHETFIEALQISAELGKAADIIDMADDMTTCNGKYPRISPEKVLHIILNEDKKTSSYPEPEYIKIIRHRMLDAIASEAKKMVDEYKASIEDLQKRFDDLKDEV